jgi:Lon protease-like protein
MDRNPFAPSFKDLPETLPVFPLPGVLLLPMGHLPLNIFEQRYVKMVEDALTGNRIIGMIQPSSDHELKPSLYETGCAGKITDFSETSDGRYLVTLTGLCRFRVQKELDATTPYRQVQPRWTDFEKDLSVSSSLNLDRKKLHALLESYFRDQGFGCDWKMIEEATDGKLITCLSMICPFSAKEKQLLLEAPCCKTRGEAFMTMLEMAVHEKKSCDSKH